MGYPPKFDELFVLSDIHMGGRKNGDADFQIFNRGQRLANFIKYVGSQRPDGDVALVLNGDVIDSLAETEIGGYVALDAATADAMMNHLYTDASFSMVWQALADFIKLPKRHLVVVVGNHDVELALPTVESSILDKLSGSDGDARSRIVFATHGGGFACQIGRSRVFCTHGNEVDEWNFVDQNLVGQLANAINGGRGVDRDKWKPNAGTRLVIDVMNTIKRRYPFVDLLKPEVAAIAGVLVALDKDVIKGVDFGAVFPIVRDKVRGRLVTGNLLGAADATLSAAPPQVVADEVAQQLLGPSFGNAVRAAKLMSGAEDDLLLNAGAAVRAGLKASEAAASIESPETLGWWDVFKTKIGLVPPVQGLCYAMKDWVSDESTYAVTTRDECYERMQDRVGDSVDFVVTGHTHLARAIPMSKSRFYYNCGTWIRLLRLTNEVLGNPKTFEQYVWGPLTSSRMSDLDDAEIPGANGVLQKLVFDRTNAVRIWTDGTRVSGDLLRVEDGPNTVSVGSEPGTTAFTVG